MHKVIIFIIGCFVLVFVGIYVHYYFSIKKANRESRELWINERYIPLKIDGTVISIETIMSQKCFAILTLHNFDNEFVALHLNACALNSNDIEIEKGDSLYKAVNSSYLYVLTDGTKKTVGLDCLAIY